MNLFLVMVLFCASILSMADETNRSVHLAIFVSGTGTNMVAILEAIGDGKIQAKPCLVISNRKDAPALTKAQSRSIPTAYLPSKNQEDYSQQLIDCLKKYDVTPENGLICLAGFMKILDKKFVNTFKNRILNIHPSLLPVFPGLDAIGQALKAKATKTGCTVHLVDEGVDTGPILGQAVVDIAPEDTHKTLGAKIHVQEHMLYPKVIEQFIEQISY
jgi:phosphoribosylglycinamide formyltransferase 1